MEQSDFIDELLSKHKTSTQDSSRTLCAVVGAAREVLKAENLEPTPPALLAATMTSLEKPAGYESPEVFLEALNTFAVDAFAVVAKLEGLTMLRKQVATALCTILSACLDRVPNSLVRTKFVECSTVVRIVLDHQRREAGAVRAAAAALGQILAAMGPDDWPAAVGPFNRLLELSVDSRPKLRRAAHSGIAGALAAASHYPAAVQASQALLKVCQQILPGPEAALRAVNSSKGKSEADAVLQKAVSDAIHLLNLLKVCLPSVSGPAAVQVAGMLPKLFHLQHPLLTRQAADVLAVFCGSKTINASSRTLGELLSSSLEADTAWRMRDANARLSLVRLVEHGLSRLQQVDFAKAAGLLSGAFGRLLPELLAHQEDVRQAATAALKALVRECLRPHTVNWAEAAPALQLLEGALGLAHQDGWPLALSVVEELLHGLRAEQLRAVRAIIARIGEILESVEALSEDEDAAAVRRAAANAVGAGIASLGPKAVLDVLPLNLEAGEGRPARAWLLPLLRQHIGSTSLDYWGSSLLPIARAVAGRGSGSNMDRLARLECRALEAQLWSLLPSFCTWPRDMAAAFRKHAQAIGKAFENREELRPPICSALERLCVQNTAALKASGKADSLALANLSLGELEDDNAEASEPLELIVPPHYTAAVAEENLACLRVFAKNWMPLLFNAYVAARPGRRAFLGRAISAYAVVMDPDLLDTFFKTVVKKLIKATQDAKSEDTLSDRENLSLQRCTFMELALMLGPGLPPSAVTVLFKASAPALQEKDQAVQKRAYRLLAYILEQRENFARENFQEILDSLLLGVASSMSAAKRYRLQCLQAVTLILQQPNAPEIAADEASAGWSQSERQKQVVSLLVGEIVLCIKEVNKRTRIAAYELLVGLAKVMHEEHPPQACFEQDAAMAENAAPGDKGGLDTLFMMILGGLVGASPHMVSASVMALARLLYEFSPQLGPTAPQLLPVVLSLLRSKSREIVQSVLGFVKVCAAKLPVEVLQQHLKSILDGILLWSEDSKNKFKLKVRMIVERLVRRLGHDAVAEQMPEAERKLLTHIRKEHKRRQRLKGQSEAGQVDLDQEEGTTRSKSGRTGQSQPAWATSEVFSSDEERGAPSRRTGKAQTVAKSLNTRHGLGSKASSHKGKVLRMAAGEGDEPLDLLDQSKSRAMLRAAAGRHAGTDDLNEDFAMEGGRMVIKEEAPPSTRGKRKRGSGAAEAASDDSDFDDLRHIAGATAAMRAGRGQAGSTAGQSGAQSLSRRSLGTKTSAGRSAGARSSKSERRGKEHTGARFAATKGAGGDVKGSSKVEPYAYWPLDRKMLNKRPGKKLQARKGLAGIVQAAQTGAAKGRKAKRQKRS